MTDDERTELLAQALWLKVYGVRKLTPKWEAFAATNTAQVQALRTKAAAMLSVSQGLRGPMSSLGWLA